MTCPQCSATMTRSISEPATAGGTVVVVHRCPSCDFTLYGVDPGVERRVLDPHRTAVRYADPARFVTGTTGTP